MISLLLYGREVFGTKLVWEGMAESFCRAFSFMVRSGIIDGDAGKCILIKMEA